jgi:hypothetical protein
MQENCCNEVHIRSQCGPCAPRSSSTERTGAAQHPPGRFMFVPCRTLAGETELIQPCLSLGRSERNMLTRVDGERSLLRLLQESALEGMTRRTLDVLVRHGLVALQPTAALAAWDAVPVDAHATGWPPQRQASRRQTASPRSFRVRPRRSDAPYEGDEVKALPAGARAGAIVSTASRYSTVGSVPDRQLIEARDLVGLALQRVAPLRGAWTRVRVHRARNRRELRALLPAVRRSLSGTDRWPALWPLMRRVEVLLAG